MIARHVNLGRVVIVAGGLLVLIALASQAFIGGQTPWVWAAVFLGGIVGFLATILLGRTLGGWIAVRLGRDVENGRRTGISLIFGIPVAAFTLYRWLGLG